ncbi:bZIP transcription factor [Halorubrum rutilum]|uniref:BZIP transcription factor n=1 Tax=Halorubrum rutilum TaxID=1364933 RepID=A0ABD6AKS9_9EURY|nr:bZIP transcription factor [Halorubrum rutilum]
MSNRVEDLERQVAELQAAVNGLTEELVEMKERVRQVEDAQEVSVQAGAAGEDPGTAETATASAADEPTESAGGETRTHSDDHVEVVERTGGEGADEAAGAGADAESDDMVVPEQEATTPDAEAGESEATSDDEESDSDIIVA